MSDNVAVLQGFTQEIIIDTPTTNICALVKPNTVFTRWYRAWNMDTQEFITVDGIKAGWNMAYGRVVK